MKKICFVVQRYGEEVNGGAELQCKLFAEHLNCNEYEVHVLTTKAIDYMTWANEYEKDEEEINGVHIHRFGVDYERDQNKFNKLNAQFLGGWMKESREQEWFDLQGPVSSGIINYIKCNTDMYSVFVFFTYLYYPTVMGLPIVKDKSILIPEAHDEPYIHMKTIKRLFLLPKAYFFNTEEERDLVHKLFNNNSIPDDIGGIGIDVPQDVDVSDFKNKYGLDNYIIYVGRIDEGKNCSELFSFFRRFKQTHQSDLKLVLVGKKVISVPDCNDIISLGFISAKDKTNGMAGAKALVLPSRFESLSMVVLEAMMLKTPVIVNGDCEVLKGHCIKSNGAFYYNNYYEWAGELDYIFDHKEVMEQICRNAYKYVNENYRWDVVIDRLRTLIDSIR